MNLCSTKHDEVCYEGRTCPVCDLRSEKDSEIDELKQQLKEEEENTEAWQEKYKTANEEVERLCRGQLDGER